MMSSTAWARLVLSPTTLHSVVWRHAIESLGTIVVPGEWSIVLALHCSCLSTHLAGIDCAAYPHVLQAYDDLDVRCLGNVCVCIENMCA
jgi:hypothetical protein